MLAGGIDSLYVSFKGEVDAARIDGMELLKAKAQETGQSQLLVSADDRKALMQPSGWGDRTPKTDPPLMRVPRF